jgi:hypothetical protein
MYFVYKQHLLQCLIQHSAIRGLGEDRREANSTEGQKMYKILRTSRSPPVRNLSRINAEFHSYLCRFDAVMQSSRLQLAVFDINDVVVGLHVAPTT